VVNKIGANLPKNVFYGYKKIPAKSRDDNNRGSTQIAHKSATCQPLTEQTVLY